MTKIRKALRAATRFQFGVLVVRDCRVSPCALLAHAKQRRTADDWHEPTMRQLTILRRLASGADIRETAAMIGMSPRTIQREVSLLASANGVVASSAAGIAAGALCEALGWT